MSDQKRDQFEKNGSKPLQAAPNHKAGGEQAGRTVVKSSSWKRFLSRKWIFPAAYLAVAAIILGIMIVYQGPQKEALDEDEIGLESIGDIADGDVSDNDLPVVALPESFAWPTSDMTGIEVVMPFYEDSLSNEEKTMAVIRYENTFVTSKGIALARHNQESFPVTAALSGTVTRAEHAPVIGNVVEIEHPDGFVTIYYSLADVQVSEGQQVRQGDVIARAGQNEYEKDLGVHLHFEVHQNGEPVNPYNFLPEMD